MLSLSLILAGVSRKRSILWIQTFRTNCGTMEIIICCHMIQLLVLFLFSFAFLKTLGFLDKMISKNLVKVAESNLEKSGNASIKIVFTQSPVSKHYYGVLKYTATCYFSTGILFHSLCGKSLFWG